MCVCDAPGRVFADPVAVHEAVRRRVVDGGELRQRPLLLLAELLRRMRSREGPAAAPSRRAARQRRAGRLREHQRERVFT